jgi:predicted GH43/DUF377 family glycosyl hydrolase
MITIQKEGVLLEATHAGFENEGVLNPAAIRVGDKIHLFYRGVAKGNHSSIGHCVLDAPLHISERGDRPLLFPQFDYESHGMEDPRIVCIEGCYYLSYTAYDGVNALGALATSYDLVDFEKHGIILPKITFEEFRRLAGAKGGLNEKYLRFNEHEGVREKKGKVMYLWNKNLIFFPRRIEGKLVFLHRVRPDIQIVAIDSLSDLTTAFWQVYFLALDEHIVLRPRHPHEVSYIGGGCPPIETAAGWLLIYHGVHDTVQGYVYSACAALLDLQDPQIELARLPYPLFGPELDWELKGEVDNVCFPTGSVVIDDQLYIYYGAADERIACATVSLSALIQELLSNVLRDEN